MAVEEKFLLDRGARIGLQWRLEGVKKTQIEGVLASLEFTKDDKACLLLTVAYAYRQAERLHKGHNAAHLINEALNEIYNRGGGRDEGRRLLGIAKWVYETVKDEKIRLPVDINDLTFEKYLEILRSMRGDIRRAR